MKKSTTAIDREAATSLYRASLDTLPNALILLRDGDANVAYANKAACQLLQREMSDIRRQEPSELLLPAQAQDGLFHSDLDGEPSRTGLWQARCVDGTLVPVRVVSTRLVGESAVLLQLEPLASGGVTKAAHPDARSNHRVRERFALLTAASTVLTSTSDYVAALDELARLALPTLGISCLVHVVDGDAGLLPIVAAHLDAATAQAMSALQGSGRDVLDLPRRALETGSVAIYHGAPDESSGDALLPSMSGCAVPIRLRDDLLGTLTFFTDDVKRCYDADDAALGQELGRRIAQAMDSARLLEREQRRRRQLAAVREVAAELTNELDLSRLLDLIIRRVAELVSDSAGVLYIWDEDAQQLIPRSTHKSEHIPAPLPIALGEGVSGRAAQEHRTIVVEDYRSWDGAIPRLRGKLSFRAALASPVIYQSRLVGVITLARGGGEPPFSAGQQDLVGLFADHAAVAIEHARLFEREQERRRQLEAIREVSTEITRELNLPRLLNTIWQRAAGLVQGDRGALFLWDEESQEIRPCVWPSGFREIGSARIKLGQGIVGTVAETRSGILLNDARDWHEALPSFLKEIPAVAFMAEPIIYQDRLIGVIGMGRSEVGRPYTSRDQETLRLFAQHAAIAIENARLFEQEQKRRRQVEAIRDVASEIVRELDLVRVLELTFQRAIELIRGTFGWVYLWDEQSQTLIPRATTVIRARDYMHRRRLGEGASGIAAERRVGVVVNNYPSWEHALPRIATEPYAQAALAAPILYQDRLVGVITITRLDEDDPFTGDELALLSLFADHAAIAIENASLYQREQLERRQLEAIRDLTSDIIRELDIETVLNLTIERAISLVQCQTGVVFEWDEAAQLLRPRTVAGFDRTYPRPTLQLGQGISGRVAQTFKGIFENDYPVSSSRLDYVLDQADMRAAMAAPVVFKDRLIGVVTVGRTTSDTPFSSEDLELLCLFANHAAIAIENARLYAELSDRAEQMKKLVGKLLRAQDEERRRVAYEVHDGLAQVAAAAHQHLEAFAAHNRPRTDAGRRALDAARQTAQQTVQEARRVIAGLRPTVLDDLGLTSALRQEIEALKKDGFSVSYEENLGSNRLPQEIETTLFSVGREALTNVRKHAGPTRVEVRLTLQALAIKLEIQDFGRGFDSARTRVPAPDQEPIGLRGMEERVAWLGGQLTLESKKGKGSRVAVLVPLESSAAERVMWQPG
ncbi:MAG: GAF domain-containing protein [Chloroflexota bacterium]